MVVDAQRWDRQCAEHDPPTFEDPARRVVERAELVERVVERAEGNRVAVEAVGRAVRPAVTL